MAVVTPDIAELFEEAYERAGLEMRSGYDLRTIRRSLNILTLEWQNRGLNLFTVEAGTIPLVAGTNVYTMPSDTIDVIETQLRTGTGQNQIDTTLERISVATYAQQTNKLIQGRPTQVYVDRGVSAVTVTVWPVPDGSQTYSLAYYRLKGIDGLSSGISGSAGVPPRFVPALVAGLAFQISMKKPEAAARAQALQAEYERQFALAAAEDETRASFFITPWSSYP
jgi:hypothetical protein